jgi:hypothetical protein
VYSVASAATGSPTSRRAALVTGLMLMNSTSPLRIRPRVGPSNRRATPRAMFELVTVR